MKCADKHKLSPGQRRLFFAKQSDFVGKSGRGYEEGLVEAEAGDVGGLDDIGMVVVCF